MDENISFLVNHKQFSIEYNKIINFPLKDAYLNVLVRNANDGSLLVEKDKNGAIIISNEYSNFELMVKLYNNPTITLFDLLEIDSFLQLIERIKPLYPKPKVDPVRGYLTFTEIKQEHLYEIRNHPSYKWMQYEEFKALMEEFSFYGVDSLFIPNYEIDPTNLKHKVKSTLKELFRIGEITLDETIRSPPGMVVLPNTYTGGLKYTKTKYYTFMDKIKRMNAIISGSTILKSVLEIDWPTKDLDIYLTESDLFEFIRKHFFNELYYQEIKSTPGQSEKFPYLSRFATGKKSIEDFLVSRVDKDDFIKTRITEIVKQVRSEKEPLLADYPGLHQRIMHMIRHSYYPQNESDIEKMLNRVAEEVVKFEIKLEMAKFLECIFEGTEMKLIDKSDSEQYNGLSGISHVIEIKINNIQVEFIICKCTVPYVIDNFDFGFNKIYYDGYSVNCLDWKAVLNRMTSNNYMADNKINSYVFHIERIRKYFNRGFFVTLGKE